VDCSWRTHAWIWKRRVDAPKAWKDGWVTRSHRRRIWSGDWAASSQHWDELSAFHRPPTNHRAHDQRLPAAEVSQWRNQKCILGRGPRPFFSFSTVSFLPLAFPFPSPFIHNFDYFLKTNWSNLVQFKRVHDITQRLRICALSEKKDWGPGPSVPCTPFVYATITANSARFVFVFTTPLD